MSLAFCWTHVRRKFYEFAQSGPAPIATESLAHIAALYQVEADIRGRPAEERHAARQASSRPIIAALEPWLREKLGLVSQKSKLADAIRYALSRWQGLSRFLDDGRVEIGSNVVERAIRPIALSIARTRSLPAPTAAASTGPSSPRWWRPASSTPSTRKPISATSSPASSPAIPRARSTTCCLRPTRPSRLRPWPENSGYKTSADRQLENATAGTLEVDFKSIHEPG